MVLRDVLLFNTYDICIGLLAVAAFILIAIPVVALGGPRDIFSYHPILMSLGLLLVSSVGIVVYTSPLSVRLLRTRAEQRFVHGALMSTGAVLAAVGYLLVVLKVCLYSEMPVEVLLGIGLKPVQRAHAYAGYLVLGLLLYQSVSGHRKRLLLKQGRVSYKHHAVIGAVTFTAAIIAMALGSAFWVGEHFMRYDLAICAIFAGLAAAAAILSRVLLCSAASRPSPASGVPSSPLLLSSSHHPGLDGDVGSADAGAEQHAGALP